MLTPSHPATAKVSLLFTSDEHGYISRQSKLQKDVSDARQANPEGTLFISCGDVFEGSAENGVLGVNASRTMLETAGYDVMTMGNHDFDRGPEVARSWIKESPCDVICSNLKDAATGQLLEHSSASKVYELNGVKVGLIGATTTESVTILPKSKLQGLAIEDPTVTVKAEVDKLKAEGVEVIGLVSHLGLPTDRKMADAVPELDFILGGHTHDALETPEKHGQTLIMHPGCFRKSLGHLDLDVDPTTGEIKNVDYKLVRGENGVEDGGPVGHLANKFRNEVDAAMGQVVATLPKTMTFDPNTLGEGMESLTSTAILKKTQADLVMLNQKGLRASLPQGEVKVGDVYNVFPFDNHLVTLDLTAEQALAYYSESFRRGDQTSFILPGGESSIMVAVDRQTHEPQLVVNTRPDQVPAGYQAQPGQKTCATVTSLVPANTHLQVATIDFLLEGGLNYFTPGSQQIVHDHGSVRDALREHLTQEFPIQPT